MIVIKLVGGLGNQLFQYALGEKLREIYGEQVYYDKNLGTPIFIENFCVGELPDWNDALEKSEIRRIRLAEKEYHVLQKLLCMFHLDYKLGERLYKFCIRKGYYFNYYPYYYGIPKTDAAIKVAYGYFQCAKYFESCKGMLKEKFCPKYDPTPQEKAWLDEISSCNAVAVQIRLGDYIEVKKLKKKFNICTSSYFYKGAQYICERVSDPVFFIFSNDIDMVKEKYRFPCEVRYVEGLKEYQDLRLMTHCKHYLISNSSFAWWGAYLSNNDARIVVAPSKWRAKEKRICDIFMPDMVRIDVDGAMPDEMISNGKESFSDKLD